MLSSVKKHYVIQILNKIIAYTKYILDVAKEQSQELFQKISLRGKNLPMIIRRMRVLTVMPKCWKEETVWPRKHRPRQVLRFDPTLYWLPKKSKRSSKHMVSSRSLYQFLNMTKYDLVSMNLVGWYISM